MSKNLGFLEELAGFQSSGVGLEQTLYVLKCFSLLLYLFIKINGGILTLFLFILLLFISENRFE